MNQDLFELFISNDADKNPARVLKVTPDIFVCMVCEDWLGIEEDTPDHEVVHPLEHCHFCNRAIYIKEIENNPFKGPKELTAPVCYVCYKNALERAKLLSGRWNYFCRRIKKLLNMS